MESAILSIQISQGYRRCYDSQLCGSAMAARFDHVSADSREFAADEMPPCRVFLKRAQLLFDERCNFCSVRARDSGHAILKVGTGARSRVDGTRDEKAYRRVRRSDCRRREVYFSPRTVFEIGPATCRVETRIEI